MNLEDSHEIPSERLFKLALASPHCWKASKIFDFLKESSQHINLDNKVPKEQKEFRKFRESLEKLARDRKLWSQERWSDVIGDADFKCLLRDDYKAKDWMKPENNKWQSSAIRLLSQCRNKSVHPEPKNPPYSKDEKLRLGWYKKDPPNQFEFRKNLFCQYITTHFPRFLPFLWEQFSRYKTDLSRFYPEYLDYKPTDNLNFCVNDFVTKLEEACQKQVEEGIVEWRFEVITKGGTQMTVELRPIDKELIKKLLGEDSKSMKMLISTSNVLVQWYDKEDETMEYIFTVKERQGNINFLAFAADAHEVHAQILSQVQKNTKSKITVFTSKDVIEEAVKKLGCEKNFNFNPVKWADLSKEFRQNLESDDNYIVSIMTKPLPLGNFRSELLGQLKGHSLNALLKSKSINILNHPKKCCEPYINRVILKLGSLNLDFFDCITSNDIVLIINNTSEVITQIGMHTLVPVECNEIFLKAKEPKLTPKLLIIEDEFADVNSIFEEATSLETFIDYKAYVIIYLGNGLYRWKTEKGATLDSVTKFNGPIKISEQRDTDFIENRSNYDKSERIFVHSGNPGMGKTQFLYWAAKQLMEKPPEDFTHRIVIFLTVNSFIANLTINNVVKAISDSICSENGDTDRGLVEYLLKNNRKSENKILFEIFLDNLDEVKEKKEIVYDALETILDKMPFIRIWITLQDRMLNDIQRKFNCSSYLFENVQPLAQIDFLMEFWRLKCKTSLPNSVEFIAFAKACVHFNNCEQDDDSISGNPLLLYMIAETYKSKVEKHDFSTSDANIGHTQIGLYDQFIKKFVMRYITDNQSVLFPNLSGTLNVTESDYLFKKLYNDMENSLMFLSVEYIFSNEVANRFKWYILGDAEDVDKKLVEASGIVKSSDPITYYHMTFPYYFVAKLAHKMLSSFVYSKHRKNMELSLLEEDFSKFIFTHVMSYNFFDNEFDYVTVCYFLNQLCHKEANVPKIGGTKEDADTFFKCVSKYNCYKLSDREKVYYYLSPWFWALKKYKFRNLEKTLLHSHFYVMHLLSVSLYEHFFDIFEYIVKKLKLAEKYWYNIPECYNENQNILHRFILGISRMPEDYQFDKSRIESFLKHVAFEHNDFTFIEDINDRIIESTIITKKNSLGQTPLHFLVQTLPKCPALQKLNLVSFFVEKLGANFFCRNNKGRSVLHFERLNTLPEFGVLKKIPDFEYTFLSETYPNLVEYFCSKDSKAKELLDPFAYETMNYGKVVVMAPLVQLFQFYGNSKQQYDPHKLNQSFIEVIKSVKLYGINFNVKDGDGKTVFERLSENWNDTISFEVFEELFLGSDNTISSTLQNSSGWFKLMQSVLVGRNSVFLQKLHLKNPHLLQLPDKKCMKGLLHYFVEGVASDVGDFGKSDFDEKKVIELLQFIVLECKNMHLVEERDQFGKTPLLLLLKFCNADAKMFEIKLHEFFVKELRADINAQDDEGNTVVHLFGNKWNHQSYIYYNILRFFLDNGYNVNDLFTLTNRRGQTEFQQLLEYFPKFAPNEWIEIIKLLQDHNADFELRDNNEKTVRSFIVESLILLRKKLNIDKLVYNGVETAPGLCALKTAIKDQDLEVVMSMTKQHLELLNIKDSDCEPVINVIYLRPLV